MMITSDPDSAAYSYLIVQSPEVSVCINSNEDRTISTY